MYDPITMTGTTRETRGYERPDPFCCSVCGREPKADEPCCIVTARRQPKEKNE